MTGYTKKDAKGLSLGQTLPTSTPGGAAPPQAAWPPPATDMPCCGQSDTLRLRGLIKTHSAATLTPSAPQRSLVLVKQVWSAVRQVRARACTGTVSRLCGSARAPARGGGRPGSLGGGWMSPGPSDLTSTRWPRTSLAWDCLLQPDHSLLGGASRPRWQPSGWGRTPGIGGWAHWGHAPAPEWCSGLYRWPRCP